MKRMLFNATHAEEMRVAIVSGQKLLDIDIEVTGHESRKSNIYKGKITRIEPSLEAAFVDYGEERHGFLPFKEISRIYFKPGIDVHKARIQDAVEVGQELLVQMEKEERGNKGAALTSNISLAGRYMVLMPNNPRGGGVSRRIEGDERNELREVMDKLEIPPNMGVIARTAAIERSAEELQWDLNYLLQLWAAIDEASKTPGAFLIYQESSLIIRAIRDYFTPDISEILIDSNDIYEQAKQFVGYVMPDMEARVKRYSDDIPLFNRFQIEHQVETAHNRQVPLPSGGSIVIDHTEALVAIDVNSARATKGSDIEETATRTNLEAADEAARQLRLRDLGGLIVIDFIDMDESKNQKAVEARLKDALSHDKARVQMGKISKFGLMELSRQRLRPSLAEGSHTTCPRCMGTGVIRDVESSALHILRVVQEEAMKDGTAAIQVQVPVDVATFLLNEKRLDIAKLETRLRVSVILIPNRHLETPHYKLSRIRQDDSVEELKEPTYKQVDEPAEPDYLGNKVKDQKTGQIPKVKGVTPPTAAPIVEPRAKATVVETKPSLWSKIKAWFSSAPAAPAVTEKPQGPKRGNQQGRDGRRGGRHPYQRNDRTDRTERTDRKDGADKPQGKKDNRPARPARGERTERNAPAENAAPPAATNAAIAATVAGVGAAAAVAANVADTNANPNREQREPREPREGGRRGRNGRGERNDRGERGPRPPRDTAAGEAGNAAPNETAQNNQAAAMANAAPTTVDVMATAPANTTSAAKAALPAKVVVQKMDVAQFDNTLAQADLAWVQTDAGEWQAVQDALKALPRPVHVPRERVALPPLSTEPLVQVETLK